MDSLLSLQTATGTISHPPPPPPAGFSTPNVSSSTAASATATNIALGVPLLCFPNLLVPKPEPFDEFFATQDPQQQPHGPADGSEDHQEPDLYSQFYRVSKLFNDALGDNFFFGAQHIGAPQNPIPNTLNLNFPDPIPDPDPDPKAPSEDIDPIVEDQNLQSEDGNAVISDQSLRAIVPVPPPEQSAAVVVRRRQSRVKELVRVIDLEVKDQMQHRELVRRTRMVYDSLKVWATIEEEKRAAAELLAGPDDADNPSRGRRIRGDLRAAVVMRRCGLWLNRDKRIVGAIPGVFVGDVFLFRMELCVLGLHGQIQAGIDYLPSSMSANGEPIATSVIVSGGYEDDLDDGEVIIYTGHGGQEKNSSRQICDQKLEGGNLALERSMHYGIEVRVIRGMKYEGSASSSGKIYVYDGVYRIVECWFDMGRSGFGVYKYKLCRIEGQPKMGSAILKEAREIRRSGLDFKPVHCLSVDMSNKRENVAVRLFNDIDDSQVPLCYEYLPRTTFPPFVFHQSGKATGCDCKDGCADGCFCAMKNGGEFPYNLQGLLVRGKPLIFECGPFCSCPPNCRNRVTQKGLKNRLEVFRSRQTGWGVRSLDVIHAGAFICEYTGVVLTREQAQILTMNGDSSIYPNRFSEKWAEWGDLSQIYADYVRPSYPSVPPLDFSLDVSSMRNVACYISHSSTPNVLVQFVLYDHNNLMFPHVMLFAMENIPPMRELSLDYGVADEWTGKLSICN